MHKVSLVIFDEKENLSWKLGKKFSLKYNTKSLIASREAIATAPADFILFWDSNYSLPSENMLEKITNTKGDLWHLGSNFNHKLPLLSTIQPTHMHHVVADPAIDHSSWKVSFRGCLLKKDVFDLVPLMNYTENLDVIGLDFGFKAIQSGVLTRYTSVFTSLFKETNFILTKEEELFFVKNNFDKKAYIWSYMMSFFSISPWRMIECLRTNKECFNEVYDRNTTLIKTKKQKVSAVIATLDRYFFLEKLLFELQDLEPALDEIIIVDQTPEEKRNRTFLKNFSGLPITYVETNKIGQCSARNKGVSLANSDFIWFLDDDMKAIPKNYLSKHLSTIESTNADISCGVPDEVGTNYIDRSIPKIEISAGFPTNDVFIKRELLISIGGFDEKMDQKQSEDQELGLRCVKHGALSVKNNQLQIVHLRAGRGGLRSHNVRKITFSSSRNKLFQRRFLHHSEIYLNLKHFAKEKVFNAILLNIRGTFIIRGGPLKKLGKILIGFIMLPHTLFQTYNNYIKAQKLLRS